MRDWKEYLRAQEIKIVPIGEVKPYANNPRNNERAVPAVAASIERFGFRNPILVDGDGVIVEGHTRRLAALKLGMEEVPVIYATDLTPEETAALRVIDNKTAELADWDFDALAEEMASLRGAFDFGDFGFKVEELADMGLADGTDEDAKGMDYEMGEDGKPAVEVRTKRGDVWRLGGHVLMCGDSTSKEDVARLMGGEKADCLITDPPYNVNIGAQGEQYERIAEETGRDYQWRHEPCAYGWMPGAAHKWVSGRDQTTVSDLLPNALMKRRDGNIILKLGGKTYALKADAVVTEIKGTVLEFPKPSKSELHPTIKPLALIRYQMENSTDYGDVVLDLFGGSGTTLIAAERSGRKCRMMELDPKYATVILNRWEAETGGKAELVADGGAQPADGGAS